ncbi:MAG: hypothetical protein E6H47_15645 [Betaproteobacteria bacterium]|nr:MAG: hypothetical protein E6H47_15645 [Betaproteobacteria bacterium]
MTPQNRACRLRLGFQNAWKYHYTPGMHENVTIGEIVVNRDVWKGLSPTRQEIIKSAANETFLVWWAKWRPATRSPRRSR